MRTPLGNEVKVTFMDGAKVSIEGSTKADYYVCFKDADTGVVEYDTNITPGMFAAANPKYYERWNIVVRENNVEVVNQTLDLKDQHVMVQFDSKSLGDNVSWMPIVAKFAEKHGCRMHVSTFWNPILAEAYPGIIFHEPGKVPSIVEVLYKIGAFDVDYHRNKRNWRTGSLQQIASDILGLPKEDVQPRVKQTNHKPAINRKYVAISEFSTWKAKQWLNPNGWPELIKRLHDAGYGVVSVSKEISRLSGVVKCNGRPIEETIANLRGADMFIGVSCGLSVLAWAVGTPVCIVSGSTATWSEFQCAARVTTDSKCSGCFNNLKYQLERANWTFCPEARSFECGRMISPDKVWEAVKPYLAIEGAVKPRTILYITPHCSTGGGPQYMLRCIEEALNEGYRVAVAEYNNISDHYIVQRNRIRALPVQYRIMDGDKLHNLNTFFCEVDPDIVHVQEFSENFMSNEVMDLLYSVHRKYRIIETPHNDSIMPASKRYRPDAFAFVSDYHASQFKDYGVPINVVEYDPPPHGSRPDRTKALRELGLDPEQRHILHVGLFCSRKNQGMIFDMARRLPEMQFHFIGNMASNFESYWKPLMDNRPANCNIWGERDDTDKFYAAMDAFIFVSTIGEMNPLVIKEALSWQMPVFMRPLPVYMGKYDNNPLVTYLDDDIGVACEQLQGQYEGRQMAWALKQTYDQVSRDVG